MIILITAITLVAPPLVGRPGRSTLCSMGSDMLRFTADRRETAQIFSGFGQQPVPKGCNLGESRCGLGADDPVRLGYRQSQGERPYEAPAEEIPSRQRGAGEPDALA